MEWGGGGGDTGDMCPLQDFMIGAVPPQKKKNLGQDRSILDTAHIMVLIIMNARQSRWACKQDKIQSYKMMPTVSISANVHASRFLWVWVWSNIFSCVHTQQVVPLPPFNKSTINYCYVASNLLLWRCLLLIELYKASILLY